MAELDAQVLKLFEVVQQKKAEIAKAEKPNWLTNCSFGYDKEINSRTNIQVVSDVHKLVEMLAFLYEKQRAWNDATKDLDVELPFLWFGFTVDMWKSDLKTRINKIQITKKKQELDLLEEKLNRLVSKEMRDKMELEQITKDLGL